ncbi:MAG TPA: inositol monophosphatase family protein [Novosphingobium sp.]|nr:inositol monophosphatase family protein [Novosphingobium sp.]
MIDAALTAAVEAAMREVSERAILPRYQSLAEGEILAKAADDVVTVADHDSERILMNRLAAILPEATIVGEEGVHADLSLLERLGDDLCWIVDPLDGTNNFASGKPPFGVLVALAHKGETVGGWILDCLSGRFCHAAKGGGAYVDSEPVVSHGSGASPPVAAISLIYMDPAKREAVKAHIAPYYTLVDIPRCAAEQYPRVALGLNDVAIVERTLPWDHAAGALFLNEAGGRAARLDGSEYRPDDHARAGLIAAATPQLWEELAARMAEI